MRSGPGPEGESLGGQVQAQAAAAAAAAAAGGIAGLSLPAGLDLASLGALVSSLGIPLAPGSVPAGAHNSVTLCCHRQENAKLVPMFAYIDC